MITAENDIFIQLLTQEAIDLLKTLIQTPSFSKQENETLSIIQNYIASKGIKTHTKINNVWSMNQHYDEAKPTILLNSHHDTIKPNPSYTKDPFKVYIEDDKLFGLGSNDAGGALVSLLATFIYFYSQENLKYNFIYAATAEEEISGLNGIACIIEELPNISFAVVGEPTLMQMAIAEKGLMVLDCTSIGKAGHAAREEGDNAIYKALKDIEWFRTYTFDKMSDTLGKVKMSVTMIEAGQQHNVVPSVCKFTVDIRTTEVYTNEEILEIVKKNISSEVVPRSTRLQSSSISEEHPFVQEGKKLQITTYGSPTTSDQALMPFPSLKMGPGDSSRSHSADEYILLSEIEKAIRIYIQILTNLN